LTDFSGRVALVTGGSGGIGAAVCRSLAERGASVAVAYGSSAGPAEELARELRGRGLSAAAFGADMEDPGSPAALVGDVIETLGPVDVLVANHGRARPAAYEEVSAEEFDRTLAVNLRSVFLLAQAVLPGMRSRRYGRVLFMSSVAAFTGGVVGPDYAASKAGLHGLVHFLARRCAADGVTVTALAPALVDTPMLPGDASSLIESIPVGRLGRSEEVAELAVAMLGNGYLTNEVVGLDGGMYPR
jgi:3-oxoacyl-[acyl-carrier protein] reductase